MTEVKAPNLKLYRWIVAKKECGTALLSLTSEKDTLKYKDREDLIVFPTYTVEFVPKD